MVVHDYSNLLKMRGYETLAVDRRQHIFKKEHIHNLAYCVVSKDGHGKGESIAFSVVKGQRPSEPGEAMLAECDFKYLEKEAARISEAFAEMKKTRKPRHVVF